MFWKQDNSKDDSCLKIHMPQLVHLSVVASVSFYNAHEKRHIFFFESVYKWFVSGPITVGTYICKISKMTLCRVKVHNFFYMGGGGTC